MDLKEAIMMRISRRSYEKTPVDQDLVIELERLADEYSKTGDLHMQVITGDGEAFKGTKSYGLFSGAENYIAMVARCDDENSEEKIGYYGESLVLHATMMGLGTCWIAGTYDQNLCNVEIGGGEVLKCVIVFGNVKAKETLREKTISKSVKRDRKEIKDMLKAYGRAPNWAIEGVRMATFAPSANNRQPIVFVCSEEAVSAKVKNEHTWDMIDLGIGKLHFEIGAGRGHWEFGNGGFFTRDTDPGK